MSVTDQHNHRGDRPHLRPVDPDENLGRTPPHDELAEMSVLGAMLTGPDTIDTILGTQLEANDFYTPRHALIFDAILELYGTGQPADIITVTHQLTTTRDLTRAGGPAYIAQLYSEAPAAPEFTAPPHAHIVRDKAARRRLVETSQRAIHLGHDDSVDLDTIITETARQLERVQATTSHDGPTALDVDTFLATDDPDHAWLIPGLIERQDRLILTAGEGHGKSTLLRQFGIQAAAGLHPFTLERITPIRVLLVDLENTARQSRRKIRPLRLVVPTMPGDQLHIICKPDGLDLTQATDERWLNDLADRHRPDLIIIGPLYKLAAGNPNDEEQAKPAALALDRIRTTHDLALILEAHSAKAPTGNPKHRPKEPFGWSGWMRWPEFGLHLAENGQLTHWRGMRDERDFPTLLSRGGNWPWMPVADDQEMRWHQIKNAIWQAGEPISERDLADVTGISRSTIQRVLNRYSEQYRALIDRLGNEDRR